MNRLKTVVDVLCLVMFLQIILTPNAFGYIDLGTGSYLFQMLMAGLLGSLFAIKATWRNIKTYLSQWVSRNSCPKNEHD